MHDDDDQSSRSDPSDSSLPEGHAAATPVPPPSARTTGRLYHYSAEPFVLDPHRVYTAREALPMKPSGLWVSVEHDDAESFGWREWCEGESFHLEALTHRTELALRPGANILHIDHPAALLAFTRRFDTSVPGLRWFRPIDWTAVAAEYAGLLIAPYHWSLRLDDRVTWYYGWDCASGCIWDCTTLDLTPVVRADAQTPDVADARAAAADVVNGGDREKGSASS